MSNTNVPRIRCIIHHKFAILSYMKQLSLTKPHLLIMTGIPSSGKSFFAEKFSETFSAPLVDYRYLLSVSESDETAESATQYMLTQIMKTKQSLIYEGKTDSRKDRQAIASWARSAGYEPLFIWVQTDEPTARARAAKQLKHASNRVLDSQMHEQLSKKYSKPTAAEKHIVISGKHTYSTQAKVVLSKLSQPHAEISSHARPPVRSETPGRRNIAIG